MPNTLGNLPQELRALCRWIPTYPDHKKTIWTWKTDDDRAENEKSLDDLLKSYAKGKNWTGYSCFVDKRDGFVFIDIDDCIVNREPVPEVKALFQEIGPTYYELSASGKGFHLVYRGALPEDFLHTKPRDLPADKFCFPYDVEIKAGHGRRRISLTGNISYPAAPLPISEGKLTELLARCKAALPQAATPELEQASEDLVFKSMEDVQEKPIDWMWLNRIPLAAVTLFTGNPDTGKTMAYCDLAARVSSFRAFPDVPHDDRTGKPRHTFGGHVVLLAAEDDYARVIKPRLMAAGATLRNIAYVEKVEIRQGARRDERMFALDDDLRKLEMAIKQRGDSLIIIDPISSYFGKGSMYKAQDIRNVFNRLTALCEKNRCAVVAVEHFSKRTDVGAIHKLGGGVALTAAARAVFMFAKLPEEEGQYVMHFVKGNLAKRKTGLRYTIDEKKISTLPDPIPFIKWGVEDTGTADELLETERSGEGRRRDKCAAWLAELLKDGDKLSAEVYEEGETVGHKERTIKRALKEAGIRCYQKGGRWWMTNGAKAGQDSDNESAPEGPQNANF